MIWIPLILDSFVFDEASLETPEASGDMGGTQSIEQRDFPGGIRTQKSYGYFPAAQKWRARFHSQDASDRAEAVKRIMASGREVRLQYGNRAWLGRVARFSPVAKHAWMFEYELEFWPRIDYTSPGPTLPALSSLGTILALHILAIKSLIQNGIPSGFLFQIIAGEIGGPIGDLISTVENVLSEAGGNIASVTLLGKQAVFQSSLAALAACKPLQDSRDPTISSPAADAAARVQAIQNIMSAAQPTQATLRTVNPNLAVLAAQYYNDATQWRTIAAANGLADPQPIGSYNLTIPQQA